MKSVLNLSLKELAQAEINQKLILQGVSWDFYERVLEEFAHSNALHFAYDDGFLEVEVPLAKHEIPNRILQNLVSTICIEKEIDVINAGSTTFLQRAKAKGIEPDTCFYIQNESKIRGKLDIDLTTDPPSDLVIEVDITSPSLNKMLIYAALGVSEVWLTNAKRLNFINFTANFIKKFQTALFFQFFPPKKPLSFYKKAQLKVLQNGFVKSANG